jgi:hypothetical protein
MSEVPQVALARALETMLEEAAFVFAEPAATPPRFTGPVLLARLAYAGGHEGELALATTPRMAAMLAANLLGEEEGGAHTTGDDADAVGEILNMVAGQLAADLFGEGPCALGVPLVRSLPAEEYSRFLANASAAACLVDEEGRRIDLSAQVRRSTR